MNDVNQWVGGGCPPSDCVRPDQTGGGNADIVGAEWIMVPVTQETAEATLMAVWLVNAPDQIEVVDGAGRVLASVPPE